MWLLSLYSGVVFERGLRKQWLIVFCLHDETILLPIIQNDVQCACTPDSEKSTTRLSRFLIQPAKGSALYCAIYLRNSLKFPFISGVYIPNIFKTKLINSEIKRFFFNRKQPQSEQLQSVIDQTFCLQRPACTLIGKTTLPMVSGRT